MMVESVDGKSVLEIGVEENSFQKCVDATVDINSSDLSSTKTSQKKKRRRKKRRLSDSTISSVGSIEEGVSPSCVDASSTRKKKCGKKKKKKNISDSTISSLGSIKEGVSPAYVDVNSTENQDEHGQVDINSSELSNVETNQVKKCRRKKRKLDNSTVSNLGSIQDGAFPSVLVVEDSSVRDGYSDHSNKAPDDYLETIMGDEVARDAISTKNNDDHAKVDINSCDLSSVKTSQGKKRRRKGIKFSDSPISSSEPIEEGTALSVLVVEDKSISCLESIKEGASPSVLVVQDSSVRDTSSDHLDEAPACYSDKITGEKVAGDGTSFQVAGSISIGMASCECLNGESASGEQEKKIKLESLEEITKGHVVEKNASLEDLARIEIEQGNGDKSSTICEDKAPDGASGADSSVENLESDNLGVKPKLSDDMPSSSVLGVITDNDSLAVASKEGPLQKLESSPPGSLRKKLLVLDVNGLLADIVACVSDRYKPDAFVSRKADTGFNTVENREKPLLLKELNKIWEKHDPDLPWEAGDYNKSNTLLLDDSPYKALRNPPNTAIFPHSYQYKDVNDNSLGPGGDLRVYLEGLALADDVQKYVELNPFGQRPITKTNLSWSFYLKIIGTTSSLEEEDANDSLPLQ
ncbi:haloacid dehalogenase-like hydrolase (HAD) superfamily protein [Actinidia rufa]|uniref:Haloacid dehalogenase-like hydrolase (HAD) superfamily protein n=1 Tax=Actinidia rufa TaxID=165716 RepID=A0A7J0DSN2_9ERIC|nr:haloacid dehalogenase-like hydrolase (HAD) superfamily protein [Actinidia rufa]